MIIKKDDSMIKKIIGVVSALALCVSLGACSNGSPSNPTPVPAQEVIPSAVLSINEVCSATGKQLVQEGGIGKENDASYVLYRGEPWGSADTVKVSIEQYSSSVPKENVKQRFDDDRAKRTSAEDVEGMENCFVAFPSAYYYKDGYYIKITAGSGDTEEQKRLLIMLIQTAAKNLDGFIGK